MNALVGFVVVIVALLVRLRWPGLIRLMLLAVEAVLLFISFGFIWAVLIGMWLTFSSKGDTE